MSIAALRALARLARRTVKMAPLRSLLVVALIAIPVAAGTAAAVIKRTTDQPAAVRSVAHLGSADLAVDVGVVLDAEAARALGANAIDVDGQGTAQQVALLTALIETEQAGPASDELAGIVGAETGVAPEWAAHRVAGIRPCLTCSTEVRDIDLSEPLNSGIADLRSGRAPVAVNEVALTPALADRLGVGVGDEFDLADVGRLQVVGEVVRPTSRNLQLMVVTPEMFDGLPLPFATRITLFDLPENSLALRGVVDRVTSATSSWSLVTDTARPYTTMQWVPAVDLRYGARYPEAADGTPGAAWADSYVGGRAQVFDLNKPGQLSTVVAAALVIEVALVAAAAFAVGTRRRVVEFGQLATAGADPVQIRVLVLTEAITLGTLGVITGVGLALGGTWLARDVIGNATGQWVDSIVFAPIDVVGPALLGLAGAVAAAWFPARTVARVPVSTALAGRVPFRSQPTWITPVGLDIPGS